MLHHKASQATHCLLFALIAMGSLFASVKKVDLI